MEVWVVWDFSYHYKSSLRTAFLHPIDFGMVFPFSFLWCIFLIASDFFIHPLLFLIAYCLYFFFPYFSFCNRLWVSYYCGLKKCWILFTFHYQFSSVTQSCPTLLNHMDCRTPGFPVHHQLLGFTPTHIHWVGDAIQTFHLLSSPSPHAYNLSQHWSLFKWVSSSHQVAKVLEFQLQH